MDRVTKIALPRTPERSDDSSEIGRPDSAEHTSTSESDTIRWRDGATGMTPRSAPNISAAKTDVIKMTLPDHEPLPAPPTCTPLCVATHIPVSLSGLTLAAGLAMTTVGGMGLSGPDHRAAPVFYHEGLFIVGAAAMVIGLISGMMTMPRLFYQPPEPGSAA